MSAPTTIPTSATPDVVTAVIMVDGDEISGIYEVLAVTVVREVNRIPTAIVHLKDGEAARQTFAASDADLFVPGKEIEIQLGYRSQNTSVFKGIIIRHGIKVRSGNSMLVIECRDAAERLAHSRKSSYFSDEKDSDIMESILGAAGLESNVASLDSDVGQLVQFDSTDWDWIVCRAEAHGCVVIVDDGLVSVARPDGQSEPPVAVTFGTTLMELDVETDARVQDSTVEALSWNPAEQSVSMGEAEEPTVSPNGNIGPDELAAVLGVGTRSLRHGAWLKEPELKAWADGHLARQRFCRARGRATFQGFPDLRPGNTIKVEGIGERFSGTYFVSGIRHAYEGGQWRTHAQLGLSVEQHFQRFPISSDHAGGLIPAVPGLQIGIVTALAGDPDGEDRIRVRMPLVNKDAEGVWARLATLDAGSGRGTYFRPEIDDEVVIGFVHDDPRHAVILGQLHSSSKSAPEPPSDENAKKGFVSREKLSIIFDDETKSIELTTPSGNTISLSEDEKQIAVKDQHGNSLKMSSDGIVITSIKDVTLSATGNVKIEGVQLALSASASLKAEGSATAELKGGIVKIN